MGVSAAQLIAMGRFYFSLLLALLSSTVSAQRTSQGFQQQFRGPRFRQQSQTRSVGSQQTGRFRGARVRQPVSTEQALADSLSFNIPFSTPADIVRAPKRFAKALWDIEVALWREAFATVERERQMEELKQAREARGQRGSSNFQRGSSSFQRGSSSFQKVPKRGSSNFQRGSSSFQRGADRAQQTSIQQAMEVQRSQGQRTSSGLQALPAQRTSARGAQRGRAQRANSEIRQSGEVQKAQWKPIMRTRLLQV